MGKRYGVITYFSLYKKIRKKNTNYKIHDWFVPFIDWIKEITYLGKLESYIDLGPSYNLLKIHGLLS